MIWPKPGALAGRAVVLSVLVFVGYAWGRADERARIAKADLKLEREEVRDVAETLNAEQKREIQRAADEAPLEEAARAARIVIAEASGRHDRDDSRDDGLDPDIAVGLCLHAASQNALILGPAAAVQGSDADPARCTDDASGDAGNNR